MPSVRAGRGDFAAKFSAEALLDLFKGAKLGAIGVGSAVARLIPPCIGFRPASGPPPSAAGLDKPGGDPTPGGAVGAALDPDVVMGDRCMAVRMSNSDFPFDVTTTSVRSKHRAQTNIHYSEAGSA